jgi:hypothetical protein
MCAILFSDLFYLLLLLLCVRKDRCLPCGKLSNLTYTEGKCSVRVRALLSLSLSALPDAVGYNKALSLQPLNGLEPSVYS